MMHCACRNGHNHSLRIAYTFCLLRGQKLIWQPDLLKHLHSGWLILRESGRQDTSGDS